MRQILWEMDQEGLLRVSVDAFLGRLVSLDSLNAPAVLISNFKIVKTLG